MEWGWSYCAAFVTSRAFIKVMTVKLDGCIIISNNYVIFKVLVVFALISGKVHQHNIDAIFNEQKRKNALVSNLNLFR